MFASTIRQRLAGRGDTQRRSVDAPERNVLARRTQRDRLATGRARRDECNVTQRATPPGSVTRGRRPARRLAPAHNLVQEYIYEIICIKILAPIFTNALIFFLQRRTNFYSD